MAADNRSWIVTTSDDRPMDDIARDLAESGFSVGSVNAEVHSISGRAQADALQKIRAIDGVVDVSEDTPIDLGPPDSPVTW